MNIYVEGSNCSGKTTLINKLVERYHYKAVKSVPDWFRQYINYARQQEPEIQKNIYEIGHISAYQEVKQNDIVLFDRSFISTFIRIGFMQKKEIADIINEIEMFGYEPDLLLIVDISFQKMKKRYVEKYGEFPDYDFFSFEHSIYQKLVENSKAYWISESAGLHKAYTLIDSYSLPLKRISSRCILIEQDKLVLMYKEKCGETYYVFPGGGVEAGESKEDCLKRECREELGIDVNIKKYLYEVRGRNFVQHFFLVKRIGGEVGKGNPSEYKLNRKGGYQIPKYVNLSDINNLNVISPPIIKQLVQDIKNGELDTQGENKIIYDY